MTEAAESAIIEMIGATYDPIATEEAKSASVSSEEHEEVGKFEFDSKFQTRIAALAIRDERFVRHAGHLLDPAYFENISEGIVVNVALKHYAKYKCLPKQASFSQLIKDGLDRGDLRKEQCRDALIALRDLRQCELGDADYVADKVAEFARYQAVTSAILASADMLGAKRKNSELFQKIEKRVKDAVSIGLNEEGEVYEFYKQIEARTERRNDIITGKSTPKGITTGIQRMDERLFHKGWGRRELVSIMGGAKSGKTTALINFAKAASLAGNNVLYATLEVSAEIISERLDACLTDTKVKELAVKMKSVEAKINAIRDRSGLGRLDIIEYGSGTLTPQGLQNYLEKARGKGVNYDLVVVDYADIMRPTYRTSDVIENMKSIYVDLRAIAFEFNVAMLTATQTNREGHKATVAKAEHVSEDFNKVRTVDLMISINKTEEEAKKGIARLYFAASRNQEDGFTIIIKQNLEMMKFVESVIGEE